MEQHGQHGWWSRERRVRPVRGHHQTDLSGRYHRFSHGELTIDRVREGDREVVVASGRLDLWSAWEFERELRRVEASDVREIVVDLAGVEFIDSAGVEVVCNAGARSRYHSKRLSIRPGPRAVQRTFERSGFVSQLPFVAREASAPLS